MCALTANNLVSMDYFYLQVRTRGAIEREKNKRETKYHPNLRWNGVTREEKREFNDKLTKIVDRDIDIPRIVDWRVMRNLGCEKDLENMLLVRVVFPDEVVDSFMWKKAVEIKESVYKEWCLEFFSSLRVKREMSDNEILTEEIM